MEKKRDVIKKQKRNVCFVGKGPGVPVYCPSFDDEDNFAGDSDLVGSLLSDAEKQEEEKEVIYTSPRFYSRGESSKDSSHLSDERHIKHRLTKFLDEK